MNNNSLEEYILKQIARISEDLKNEEIGSVQFHRLSAQRDILYICLTAHDNKYEEMKSKPIK